MTIDKLITIGTPTTNNYGLKTIVLVTVGVYIIKKTFHLFLSPTVSTLVGRDEILPTNIVICN